MSNLAHLVQVDAPSDFYLGTATVLAAGDVMHVRLEDGSEVDAGVALAVPYVPNVGDVLLVLGRAQRHWAVGVVHGSGKTQMEFRGDVQVRAVDGELTLRGDKGVRIHGVEIDMTADKLRVAAKTVVQKCDSFFQRVRGLLNVRAKQQQTVVEGSIFTKAERADIVAERTVSINGEQIHLG